MNDLTLICETCGFPIRGGGGCIYVTFADMRHSADDIHWQTSHYACFGKGERDHYEIDADRIATWPMLAHWTAHYGSSPLDWGEDIRLYRLAPSWMVGYAFERERLLARIAELEHEVQALAGVTDEVEGRLDDAIGEIRAALAR